MEQVEDKAIEGRAQTVTEPPNSSDHPLDNTCRQTDINRALSGKSLKDATFQWTISMRISVIFLLANTRQSTQHNLDLLIICLLTASIFWHTGTERIHTNLKSMVVYFRVSRIATLRRSQFAGMCTCGNG